MQPTVVHVLLSGPQVSRSACLMTTQLICKLLRSREAAAAVDVRTWPPILDTGQPLPGRAPCGLSLSPQVKNANSFACSPDDLPKKRPAQIYKPSDPDTLAYLDFSVSTTGMLAGVKVRGTCCPQGKPTARSQICTGAHVQFSAMHDHFGS